MKILNLNFKIIGQIVFVITILSTSQAKSLDKFDKASRVSDYFSGILLFSENQYDKSQRFLKRLDGLESSHKNYSLKYLYSLVNSGNIKEAFAYSKKLEKKNLVSFESHLISGVFHLKHSNRELSKKYFQNAKNKSSGLILNDYISNSLYNWSSLSSLSQGKQQLNKLDERFENIGKIQKIFLHCFFNSSETKTLFRKLTSNQNTDFSRYNYFYALYVASAESTKNAIEIVNSALKFYPRNLLINQYKIDLNENKNASIFSCKKREHIIAEILYITANALSSQSIHSLSNFYLNLARYLNEDFHSYDTLLAENFYKINNYEKAKMIYRNISNNGVAFNWYSSKQLARIYIEEGKKNEALKLLSKSYSHLVNKEIYETFDYAEFLKNNEQFEESILLYSKIIDQVNTEHPLYAEATDGRGVAYERTGKWEKAEKDLLSSLNANPNQAYVINYLAYSWIEQGVKIEKSLSMLEKANELRANDPYITDSLGWALFKLEKYKKAKDYLQLAVKLMPGDPIVNDHYGDVLWKNGKKIQARYYWNYVLNLEKTEEELKKIIKKKIIKGL